MEYYRVELTTTQAPADSDYAVMGVCMCCNRVLSVSNSSLLYLCADCFQKMQSRTVADALNQLESPDN